ncbi:MAG: hypothetical protein GY769_22550, partial [bacterium]|nr:hypothetical protein [bacterium]
MFLFFQTGAGAEPSIFELFWSSGPIAKLVFLVLGVMSIVTWSIMLAKFFQLRKIATQTREFMEVFRASQRFSEVNAAAARLSAQITHAHPLGVEGAVLIAVATAQALVSKDGEQILCAATQACEQAPFVERCALARVWLEGDVQPAPEEVAHHLGNGIAAAESCAT